MTDTGQVRTRNEDAHVSFEPKDSSASAEKGSLYVVADGMGGHKGGEVASKLAVDTIRTEYYSSEEKNPVKALTDAFEAANRLILEKSDKEDLLSRMGTTCTAMVIRGEEAYFAHVGDSRAYLLRESNLRQITQDHSLVGEMIRSGIISQRDARFHPQRNVVTRSLGIQEMVQTDTPESPFEIKDGDVFLLCSDGLTTLVGDEEIRATLESYSTHKACKRLIDLANERGGVDNITVQIVEVRLQ